MLQLRFTALIFLFFLVGHIHADDFAQGLILAPEPMVRISPVEALALQLPAGTTVKDFDVSPVAPIVAAITIAPEGQQLLFWDMAVPRNVVRIPIVSGVTLNNVVWHPQGNALFFSARGSRSWQILRQDYPSERWSPAVLHNSEKSLRRLIVSPRRFSPSPYENIEPFHRLYFSVALGGGQYALRSLRETGVGVYTLIAPSPESPPAIPDSTAAPKQQARHSALPASFDPDGTSFLWQDNEG